jgi:hypothetical protein
MLFSYFTYKTQDAYFNLVKTLNKTFGNTQQNKHTQKQTYIIIQHPEIQHLSNDDTLPK